MNKYNDNTNAAHGGYRAKKVGDSLSIPLVMSNNYLLPDDPSSINWSSFDVPVYNRNGGYNQHALENKLSLLAESEDCVVLSTGVAALSGTFLTFLKSGDHVIVGSATYIAAYRLLAQILPEKFQIEYTIVDSTNAEEIKNALKPNTRLVHIETPANPTIRISDIKKIAGYIKEHRKINPDILFSVDNTFAPPVIQKPLQLGADLVIESLTKYVNGHGDSMGGAIFGSKKLMNQIREIAQVEIGGSISPFNAWLIQRGSITLPLRMKQINVSTLKIAEFLKQHPKVSFVSYPGLKSAELHEVAEKQMKGGFGGVVSFGLKGDLSNYPKFVNKLNIIQSAVSLGHEGSLIVLIGPDDERINLYPAQFKDGFFRMAIGIEDTEDLLADLTTALDAL